MALAASGKSVSARRTLTLVTAPSNEIITTAEAKTHLRVDHSNDDTLIDALVKLARSYAEEWCNRSFLSTTWDYTLDEGAIVADVITLPRSPLASITSITSYDTGNNSTVFSSGNYNAITNGDPGRVMLNDGNSWPDDLRAYDSMVIRFVAGWGSAVSNIPTQYREWIKQSVLLTVAALYENRGDMAAGFELPAMAKAMLQPLRILEI